MTNLGRRQNDRTDSLIEMKASEKPLLRFIEGNEKNFIIPVYQRNYDWERKQCEQLLKDLIAINEQEIKNYFLGSIVSIDIRRGKILIIDGQQRLTTLSLLLLAIYKLLASGEREAKIPKERIIDEYLINKYSEDETKKIRLKPIKNDAENFNSLFDDNNEENDGSRILTNYLFFKGELKKLDLDAIFQSIEQLMIVDIELKKGEDDPQLIFESLNSTGLSLTEADKIRNFILMNEEEKKQEEYYDNYWRKIEENTNFQTDEFIRDFLSYRTRKTPRKSEVYFKFKGFYHSDIKVEKENKSEKEKFLQELLRFSKYYSYILKPNSSKNKSISLLLQELQTLEVTVFNPTLLELFSDVDNEILNEDELKTVLELSIAYVVRRVICEVPTNMLNKVFLNLLPEVKKQQDYSGEKYLDILKYVYSIKKSNSRFPSDKELKEKLLERDIYHLKNKRYFLEKLENHHNKEPVDTSKCEIEHIMPQKLTPDWKEELGKGYEEIHEKYLNTLGNLTLTAYNKEMSNFSFKEKQTKGYHDSRLYLNQLLKSLEKFGETEIKDRAGTLIERTMKVFRYPQSKYKPIKESKEPNRYSLEDDEEDFTGKKIISFIVPEDKEKKVKHWKDFYTEIIKFLLERDFGYINKFQNHIDIGTELKQGKISKEYEKINSTAFLQVSPLSTEQILKNLKNIIDETDFNLADFEFTIKDD